MAKYIFRLDDIAENMNWDNYFLLKDIFESYNVKPIIGVIPNNRDPKLLEYPKGDINFWEEIRDLQKKGWAIALHGYDHKYVTENSGILNVCDRSEFAGLSYEEQNEKILAGKKIFEENGIRIDAFMAPSHSFDEVTLRALVNNDIRVITDGTAFFPHYYRDVMFVPQLLATPRKMPFGIYTWCLHPNTMDNKRVEHVGEFIRRYQKNIISFFDAKNYVNNKALNKISGQLNKKILKIIRTVRDRCSKDRYS